MNGDLSYLHISFSRIFMLAIVTIFLAGQPQRVYGQAVAKATKIWQPFLDVILKVCALFKYSKDPLGLCRVSKK